MKLKLSSAAALIWTTFKLASVKVWRLVFKFESDRCSSLSPQVSGCTRAPRQVRFVVLTYSQCGIVACGHDSNQVPELQDFWKLYRLDGWA